MSQDFWIRELGRLFKRSSEAIRNDDHDAVRIIVNNFNETLSNLKDDYPDNQIIQDTESVDPTEEKLLGGSVSITGETSTATAEGVRDESLYKVRSNCERISNSLNLELPEDSEENGSNNMVVVQMENRQSSKQKVSQSVTVESIQELIKYDPAAQGNQEELTELTEKIKDELDSDDPDEDAIRDYIEKAKGYSVSVAAKLSMLALQAGAIGVLGF